MQASKGTGKDTTRGQMRREKVGVVVSDKMNKTVVVAVEVSVMHADYGKFIRRTRRYPTHDEKEICGVGDTVRIVETIPMSKTKRWKVKEVVSKAVE